MRNVAHLILLAAAGFALGACAAGDRVPAREPRSAPDEGFVLRAREPLPAAPAEPPPPAYLLRRRRLRAASQAVFGEKSAALLIPRLEGVWTVTAIEVPSGIGRHGRLRGYALVSGERLQYFTLIEGNDSALRQPYVLFQAGGYELSSDLSGQVRLIAQGGFTNLTRDLSRLADQGPASKLRTPPSSATRGNPERFRPHANEPGELRHVLFFGDDLVRIERDPARYFELRRMKTKRILRERYGKLSERFRMSTAPRPLGEGARPRITPGPTSSGRALRQRRIKRDLLGAWQVVEAHLPGRGPVSVEARGALLFLDGYLVYDISFPHSGLLGRSETIFQVGVRRYAVTSEGDLLQEELDGITNIAEPRLTRIPAGTRRLASLEFSSQDELILRQDPKRYLLLRRTNRPAFVREEIAEEAAAKQRAGNAPEPAKPPASEPKQPRGKGRAGS